MITTLVFLQVVSTGCPDFTGRYVLQGEDGRVSIQIEQRGCEVVTISRATTPKSKERHRVILDGVPRPDSLWFGGRERNFVSGTFNRNVLVLKNHGSVANSSVLNWTYSFRLLKNGDLCAHLSTKAQDSYSISARVESTERDVQDAAAERCGL